MNRHPRPSRLPSFSLACIALGAAGLIGAAPGCSESAKEETWSTKSQSVLFSDDGAGPALNLTAAIGAISSDDMMRQAAIELLQQAARSDEPVLRANALEGLHGAPDVIGPVVRAALADENRGVRFVAAMSTGKLRLVDTAPLLEPLLEDPSLSVQAAAIYGLRRCGRSVDLNPLSAMIRDPNPEVKANAAFVLGELGNPSAVPMIRMAVDGGNSNMPAARAKLVDLQIAEALVKLGETSELEPIRAALFSPAGEEEIKAFACMIIGRLRDEAYVGALFDIASRVGRRQEAPEVRLAAIAALGRIDPARAPIEIAIQYMDSPNTLIRAQAAVTLGEVGDPMSLGELGPKLNDADPIVQVAAAAAILRITE